MQSTPAPTRELLTTFCNLHRQRFGVSAVIHGGKDAKLLAGLWRSHPDIIDMLMIDFFASNDPFVTRNGFTVGMFISQAGKLVTRHALNHRPDPNDWFEECRRVHNGACGLDRYRHGLKMRPEAE